MGTLCLKPRHPMDFCDDVLTNRSRSPPTVLTALVCCSRLYVGYGRTGPSKGDSAVGGFTTEVQGSFLTSDSTPLRCVHVELCFVGIWKTDRQSSQMANAQQ
jgi:hypothetical protein